MLTNYTIDNNRNHLLHLHYVQSTEPIKDLQIFRFKFMQQKREECFIILLFRWKESGGEF